MKTPVPTFGIAGTYAQALYSASIKTKTKDQVAKDLVEFGNVLKSQTVLDYMNDPFIKSSSKLSEFFLQWNTFNKSTVKCILFSLVCCQLTI